MMSILIRTISVLLAVAILVYIIDYTKYLLNCYHSKWAPVPINYKCFKCKRKGNHWIMDCTYFDIVLGFIIPYNLRLNINQHTHQSHEHKSVNSCCKRKPRQANKPSYKLLPIPNANNNEVTLNSIHIHKHNATHMPGVEAIYEHKLDTAFDQLSVSYCSNTKCVPSIIKTDVVVRNYSDSDSSSNCNEKAEEKQQYENDSESTESDSDLSDNYLDEDVSLQESDDIDIQHKMTDQSMEVMLNCLNQLKQARLLMNDEMETSSDNLLQHIKQIEHNIQTHLQKLI